MQIVGLFSIFAVVAIGLMDRGAAEVSVFDLHAAVMIFLGVLGSLFISSGHQGLLRVIRSLQEILPVYKPQWSKTHQMQKELRRFEDLWKEGKNLEALQFSEKSEYASTQLVSRLILQKATEEHIEKSFHDLAHDLLKDLQETVKDWDMMSKLGPSFGMIGTITGMVTLFKNMDQVENLGSSMSIALVAALYGISFGAGIAGPLSHALQKLLNARIIYLEQCEQTVRFLVSQK